MRHISRLKRFAWYTTVSLLVMLAVLVTVARLTIGSVAEYRSKLEVAAGKYLGQPVTIKSMDARLVGFKPSVLLNDVSLRETGTHEQLAHFAQIGIALNPLSSLTQLSPVMELTIKGARIVVIENADGSFRLQGVSLSKQAKNAGRGGALGAWFLKQSRLRLEDSTVRWRMAKSGMEVVFNRVNVELQNIQSRHRLSASVKLPQELGKEMRLALDIQGDLLNRNDWAGDIYLKTVQVKPSQWLNEYALRGVSMKGGSIDLELWSHWEGGHPRRVEGSFDVSQLQLLRDGKAIPLTGLGAQLRYVQSADAGWQINLQHAQVRDDGTPVTPFSLQLSRQAGVTSLRATRLNISNVMRFAKELPGLDATQSKQLLQMAPAGVLESLRVDMQQKTLLGAVASLKNAKISPWHKFPGVSGLNARVQFDGHNAQLELDSSALALDMPQLFEKSLHLQKVKGTVLADRTANGWRIATDRLALTNSDLAATVSMDLQLRDGEVPLISLEGRFHDGRASAVPDYLPVKIMPEASAHWLQHAFSAGRIEQGAVIMHGRLDKSLVHDEQGRFEARFDASDVAIDYKPGWPKVEGIRGEALFTGESMVVKASSGQIFNSAIGSTTARIRDFRHSVLELDGTVQATATDALRFLRQSPLVADQGLDQMQAEGMTPVSLQMTIPLSSHVEKDKPLTVKGAVTFSNNRLTVTHGVTLDKVNGLLNFTEKRFSANEIKASMFGSPATLTVFTEDGNNGQRGATIVTARGHAKVAALREVVKTPWLQHVKGESDWQAGLKFSPGEKGGVDLNVHSSMDGVAVALPEPMNKEASGSRDLDLAIGIGGKRRGIYSLHYGNALWMIWKNDASSEQLKRMAITLGDGPKPVLPRQDMIYIGGSLEQFNWRPWRTLARSMFANEGRGEKLPLQIRMQRLHLVDSPGQGDGATGEELAGLPAVDLAIRDFSYGDVNLGAVAFKLSPASRRLQFDDMSVAAHTFSLTGHGQWHIGGKSSFVIDFDSANLGKMLKELGFASVIKDGTTKANGTASWPGSPLDFSLSALEAKGHVVIKDGTIEEVKPGAGKLLGLLSLQALPRRLFLDFSDLSKKGMQFQSIKGDMHISNGNAETENMVMKSLPADILVTGRTGLVARDFDQLVMVVPNVSDTVSVAGALAWGPQVAAALVVLQKLFKSDIDAATMTRYKITGSWEKPVITRLEPLPLKDKDKQPALVPGEAQE